MLFVDEATIDEVFGGEDGCLENSDLENSDLRP